MAKTKKWGRGKQGRLRTALSALQQLVFELFTSRTCLSTALFRRTVELLSESCDLSRTLIGTRANSPWVSVRAQLEIVLTAPSLHSMGYALYVSVIW